MIRAALAAAFLLCDISAAQAMEMTSPVFEADGPIPKEFTCDGRNISPTLSWSGAPEGAKSFALIVEDPDAPAGTVVHWVISDIPAGSMGLPEFIAPNAQRSDGSRQGKNARGQNGYMGPCPPSGDKPHHYYFKLYALDSLLNLPASATSDTLRQAMENHVLDQATLVGTFSR